MSVHPCLTYREVVVAIEWLETAFGIHGRGLAAESDRDEDRFAHALLSIDGATILVESERPEELHGAHAGHGWIYVTVPDVDAHFQRAQSVGARTERTSHLRG